MLHISPLTMNAARRQAQSPSFWSLNLFVISLPPNASWPSEPGPDFSLVALPPMYRNHPAASVPNCTRHPVMVHTTLWRGSTAGGSLVSAPDRARPSRLQPVCCLLPFFSSPRTGFLT